MVRNLAILGLAAFIASAGCNAGTSGGFKRQEPTVTNKELISKGRIIAQINKNAATIKSLKASPSIVVEGDGNSGRLSGQMAMERPRDFRLEMKATGRPQADIGSNDDGFWFWINDKQEKAIYVCDYEHANANPLSVTMQPEWIMEAMGLRSISEREAATISATKGPKPNQLILTQLRADPKSGSLTKETVVDETTGEILEHRLYSGTKEKLLARATILKTDQIQMDATEANPTSTVVSFPAKMKLEWIVEKFSLEITMNTPKINPAFSETQRLTFFTEPKPNGAVRTNLATLAPAPAAGATWIHESAPAPRPGIKLGNPEAEPFGGDGASLSPRDPSTLSADLSNTPAQPSAKYVGPQVPQGTDPEAVQASARPSWGRATFR